jgi:predicted nucleic acid-binding protein
MVLVDSCVWITALRRKGDLFVKCAVEALLEEYEATLCPPVRLEVLGGSRKQDRPALERYFSVIPNLPTKAADWGQACENAWQLADQGIRVPWSDLLVATISMRVACRIYSTDKHFRVISEHLPLQLYQPGYGGAFVPE